MSDERLDELIRMLEKAVDDDVIETAIIYVDGEEITVVKQLPCGCGGHE